MVSHRRIHRLAGLWALLVITATVSPLRAADLDPFLPADTESYATLNIRQMLDSALFREQIKPALKEALDGLDEVTSVLKDLNFDPFKDLGRITFASPGTGEADRGLVVISGNFDLAKFRARVNDFAKDNDEILKTHKVPDGVGGTETIYELVLPGVPNSIYSCLFSKETILVAPDKSYIVDAIKQVRGKKKVALKNKDFQALLEGMDPKPGLSLAVMGKAFKGELLDQAPAMIKDAVEKVEALGGSVTFDKDIRMELSVATKEEKDARDLREGVDRVIKAGLAALALLGNDSKELTLALDIIKTIKVTAKGKVVTIRGRVNPEAIQDALKKD
jgi:hypothetical protein